jgi:putative ABC transport system substrate-binding protein
MMVGLGGAAIAWPLVAGAQSSDRVRRIGVLIGVADDAVGQARLAAFRKGMQELGWTEGRNLRLDVRFTAGDRERARAYAIELVGLAPDLILGNTSTVVAALQQQTRTIPIVFAQIVDPVNSGFVESLSRPGGNTTGLVSTDYGMGAKWLEILKELVPNIAQVGVLRDPTLPGSSGQLGAVQAVAPSFKIEVKAFDNRSEATIQRAIETLARERNSGVVVMPSPAATVQAALIVRLVARHRLPAIYPYDFFATIGGLLSYGVDNLDLWRRSAGYADRILRGAKPADLPVQQPTKFELVVNLKTAREQGISIPPAMLVRADRVIE